MCLYSSLADSQISTAGLAGLSARISIGMKLLRRSSNAVAAWLFLSVGWCYQSTGQENGTVVFLLRQLGDGIETPSTTKIGTERLVGRIRSTTNPTWSWKAFCICRTSSTLKS